MPKGHDQIDPALEKLIVNAQDRIIITNPYVILSERVTRRLAEAGRKGRKIYLLTDSPTTTDDPVPQGFFLREWPKLLARIPNLRIFVLDGDQRLHAKTAIVDGKISAVGSFNLDFLSSHINGEILETINNEEVAAKEEAQFWRDIQNPRNRVREYTIVREKSGKPLMRNGEPVIKYGPKNHVSPEDMFQYKFWEPLTEFIEKLPQLAPLRDPR
jgi:putative cardiolipin synthase